MLRNCFHLIKRWKMCRNFFHLMGGTVKVTVKWTVKYSYTPREAVVKKTIIAHPGDRYFLLIDTWSTFFDNAAMNCWILHQRPPKRWALRGVLWKRGILSCLFFGRQCRGKLLSRLPVVGCQSWQGELHKEGEGIQRVSVHKYKPKLRDPNGDWNTNGNRKGSKIFCSGTRWKGKDPGTCRTLEDAEIGIHSKMFRPKKPHFGHLLLMPPKSWWDARSEQARWATGPNWHFGHL